MTMIIIIIMSMSMIVIKNELIMDMLYIMHNMSKINDKLCTDKLLVPAGLPCSMASYQ